MSAAAVSRATMAMPPMTSSDGVKTPTPTTVATKRVKFVRRKKVPYYDPAEYEGLSPSSPSASSSSSPASMLLATPPAGAYAHLNTPTGTPHYQKRSNNMVGTPSMRDSTAADGLLVYLYSQQLTLSSPQPMPTATPVQHNRQQRSTVSSNTTRTATPTQASLRPPRIHTVRRKSVPKVTDYARDDVVIATTGSDAFSAYTLWSMAADAYPDIADASPSPHVSPKTLTKSLRSTPSSMAAKTRNSLYASSNATLRRPSTVAMSSASSSDSQSTISSRSGSTENLSQRSSFSSQGNAADSTPIGADVDFTTKLGFGNGFEEAPWGHAI